MPIDNLPLSASGGALLFHLLGKRYERTSIAITTNLSFSARGPAYRETARPSPR